MIQEGAHNTLGRLTRSTWRSMFGTVQNALISVGLIAIIALISPMVVRWLIVDSVAGPATVQDCVAAAGACWAFLQDKIRFIIFGRYPPEEQWRAALAMGLLLAALVVSADWRRWGIRRWPFVLFGLWIAVILTDAMLMSGGVFGLVPVQSERWSGLPLTLMLSTFGIFFAFLSAIFLALGRRSRLPAVRWMSIAYIEGIRGVPLISVLFVAAVVLPIVLPGDNAMSKLLRAQIAFIMFFAAYLAETIRGGLQALTSGQEEAGKALGLSYWKRMRLVVLPQALRATLPSIVNVFIGAFKDTSLVTIISMHDLLGTTNAAVNDPMWLGVHIEAYLFTAAIYFCFCFSMSFYSQKLERHLSYNLTTR